jgi:phosphoglycerate kinase
MQHKARFVRRDFFDRLVSVGTTLTDKSHAFRNERRKNIMLNKKTVDDLQVKGKRVLVRCDFNVPLNEKCEITDENRINAALPTIKKLMADGGKVILCSHLGKPKNGYEEALSMAPVAKRLSEKLGVEVKLADDAEVVGENARKLVAEMKDGEVILLQNTRFRKEETKNLPEFSQDLASIADVFVNDAFGTAHRAHCSTVGVAELVKENAVGYLIQKELDFLGNAVENPARPFAAVIGGKKVSDKIDVIERLLDKVDILIIGGGMAYTFFKAQGLEIGTSLLEADKMDYALEMVKKAEAKGVKLLLPVDNLVTKDFGKDPGHVVDHTQIPADEEGVDIGTETRKLFADTLKTCKTVLWNGPMGVFEVPAYAEGTKAVAQALAEMPDATTIIGGGDSAAAVNQMGFGDKMSHISTGGGASLEFLEGKKLPGVEAIQDK